ncbi:MAG: glycerate kinase [Flavobacteriaceae bacterium]|nr:glycerate kinase [Flavobacteriaceae bacterium]
MKYLLLPDKFKNSLTSQEVIDTLRRGIQNVDTRPIIKSVQVSDGGDGFLEAIYATGDYLWEQLESVNAYGHPIPSAYLSDIENASAYIELANTCGYAPLGNESLDITKSSTQGLGIQIRDALNKGFKQIYVGLGGSVTNDGGIGIAQELGYQFYDQHGKEISKTNASCLGMISSIESPKNINHLRGLNFFAVNDVENPLFGPNGAAYIYARQKGATEHQIKILDEGLQNLDFQVTRCLGEKFAQEKGAGAAGGTAYGLKVFSKAKFIRGFDFLSARYELPQTIKNGRFDFIITGEGRFDNQSLSGKFVQGILELSQLSPLSTVVIICGTSEINSLNNIVNPTVILEIRDKTQTLEYCMEHATDLIEEKITDYLTQIR